MTEDDNKNRSGITATIEVSGKAEIEKLQKENERLTEQLKTISDREFKLAKLRHNAPEDIETVEELEDFIKSEKEIEQKLKDKENQNPATPTASGHAGSGKAPLSGEPSGSLSNVREFSSVSEMMSEIQQRMHSKNPEIREEAETIQKKLLEKMAKDKKSHNFEFEVDLMQLVKDKQKKKTDSGNINWDD